MTDTLTERVDGEQDSSVADAARAGILASLKAKHRFIKWWEIEGHGLVVVRRMRRTEVLAFTTKSNAANKNYEASGNSAGLIDTNESAVKTCCVWPEDAQSPASTFLKNIFDEYPSWSGDAAMAIAKLADEGITEGKD